MQMQEKIFLVKILNLMENNDHIKTVKENNLYIVTVDEDFLSKINLMYSARKTHGDAANKKGGRKEAIMELAIRNGKWARLLRRAPSALGYLTIKGGYEILKKAVTRIGTLPEWNPAIATIEGVSNCFSIASDKKVKFKADHNDIGCLLDIDSYEDLVKLEYVMDFAEDKDKLYPYYGELKEFGEFLNNDLIDFQKQYINRWSEQFELLQGKELYDAKGNLKNPKMYKEQEEDCLVIHQKMLTSVEKFNRR